MGSHLQSIYQTSPLKSIYQPPVFYKESPVATRMTPVLVLLLTVLSLSQGDPIGDPVKDLMEDLSDDTIDDPTNDTMDDSMDDPMSDPMGDPEDNPGNDLPDVEELEMQDFEQCESDGKEGLTWDEVDACEATFGPILTEEDFQASDVNKDGILLYKEWKDWLDMDMDMDGDMVDDE